MIQYWASPSISSFLYLLPLSSLFILQPLSFILSPLEPFAGGEVEHGVSIHAEA